jgi:hypothetical protein
MQQLLIWFHVLNGLVINTKKTITMLFNTRQMKSFLKPRIIFEGTDFKYKFEKKKKIGGLNLTEDIKRTLT